MSTETSLQNAFETQLTAEVGPNALSYPVSTVGALTSPCYIVINYDNDSLREYILADSTFTGTSFASSNISKRYLAGSAAGSNLTHPVGSSVIVAPMAQHFEDVWAKINILDHGTDLAGLADDDHTIYVKADGTRAFTGTVAGVTPTADAHLSTKQYVDDEITTLDTALDGSWIGDVMDAGFLEDTSPTSVLSSDTTWVTMTSGVVNLPAGWSSAKLVAIAHPVVATLAAIDIQARLRIDGEAGTTVGFVNAASRPKAAHSKTITGNVTVEFQVYDPDNPAYSSPVVTGELILIEWTLVRLT